MDTDAETVQALNLNESASSACKRVAAVRLAAEEAKERVRVGGLRRTLARIQQANSNAEESLALLQLRCGKVLEMGELETAKAKELSANSRLLAMKGEEYKDRIARLSSQMATISASIPTVDKLEALHSEADARLAILTQKKHLLDGLQQLPPDLHLAQIKIAEKKHELSRLIQKKDAQLQRIMDSS
ncbi:hypothetical protein HDU78_004774 [Chytriomyces hyalinus]|nr:hypothetical protein HDU78_004774 [Chytriomyces hyalinus]